MKFKVNRLSDALGAEIKGLELFNTLNDRILNKILDLLYQYQVLVIRDQELTPEQHIVICNQLGKLTQGEISKNPDMNRSSPYPEMRILSNITQDGKSFGYPPPPIHIWHSDLCYHPEPATISTLHSIIVPEQGGNTIFANMYTAYETLSEEIKQKIDGLQAVFSANSSTKKLKNRCQEQNLNSLLPPTPKAVINLPDVIHPVVKVHPVTKRKSIFVNDAHTDKIIGLPKSESDELLQKIYAHSILPEFIYSHKYFPKDLILMDNLSLIHTSTHTDFKYPRQVHRVWLTDKIASKSKKGI